MLAPRLKQKIQFWETSYLWHRLTLFLKRTFIFSAWNIFVLGHNVGQVQKNHDFQWQQILSENCETIGKIQFTFYSDLLLFRPFIGNVSHDLPVIISFQIWFCQCFEILAYVTERFWSKWFNFVGGAKLLWIYSLSKVCQIGPQIGYSISNYWTSTRGGSFTSTLGGDDDKPCIWSVIGPTPIPVA